MTTLIIWNNTFSSYNTIIDICSSNIDTIFITLKIDNKNEQPVAYFKINHINNDDTNINLYSLIIEQLKEHPHYLDLSKFQIFNIEINDNEQRKEILIDEYYKLLKFCRPYPY